MRALDTNVLVRALVQDDAAQGRARPGLPERSDGIYQRWPRKSGHSDKWKLCANRSGSTPGKAEGP